MFLAGILNNPEALISDYGPLGVLLLLILPLGEDLIIIPAGILVGQGHLPLVQTWMAAYIGSLVSDGIWYVGCYHFGAPLLHKKWFKRLAHPRRLLQAKHQIEKRGAWLIVTARFVPGSRTSAMIVSGLMHLPFWKFILAEGLCLLFTVTMQISIGYLISMGIGNTSTAGKIMTIVGAVVVLTVGAFIYNWVMEHRRNPAPAPRSKARWLRRFRPQRALRSIKKRVSAEF